MPRTKAAGWRLAEGWEPIPAIGRGPFTAEEFEEAVKRYALHEPDYEAARAAVLAGPVYEPSPAASGGPPPPPPGAANDNEIEEE